VNKLQSVAILLKRNFPFDRCGHARATEEAMSKLDFVIMRARVSAEQKRQLDELALIDQSNISTIVRKALREFLARYYSAGQPNGNQEQPEPAPGPGPTNPPPPPQLQPELAVG
jgi:hypothetical protein